MRSAVIGSLKTRLLFLIARNRPPTQVRNFPGTQLSRRRVAFLWDHGGAIGFTSQTSNRRAGSSTKQHENYTEKTMNSKTWTRIIALTLLATLAIPVQMAAQDKQSDSHKYHHYQLVDIGTFGGPSSSNAWSGFNNKTMNSKGAVLGEANTSYTADPYCLFNCFMSDAFEWHNGVLTDLTGLPGNVNGTYAASINSRGWVTGLSGNGAIDPLTGYPEMVAVVWKQGKVYDLATLGGNAGAAFGINDRGQIVGGALNEVPDNFSTGFPAPNWGATPASMKVTPLCSSRPPHNYMRLFGRTEP